MMMGRVLFAVVLALAPGLVAEAGEVAVRLIVEAPTVPADDGVVFAAGGSDALGMWRPDGLKLVAAEGRPGRFVGSFKAKAGERIEYKFTRGSWETVEKAADGSERGNRALEIPDDPTLTSLDVNCTVERWADSATTPAGPMATPAHTITGDLRSHSDFESKILKNRRDILVWLPPGYDAPENAERRYPALYLHDGQNVFDAATSFSGEWRADETATLLINAGRIEPLIIVGIPNMGSGRIDEYTPTQAALPGASELRGGLGLDYARFLVEELRPFIDATYRTDPRAARTGVGGSSLGGLISLSICHDYPDVFGLCMAMSTSFWWDDNAIRSEYEADPGLARQVRYWLDAGSAEKGAGTSDSQTYVQGLYDFADVLEKAGLTYRRDYQYLVVEGAAHNEAAWADRFDDALIFLYGAESAPNDK